MIKKLSRKLLALFLAVAMVPILIAGWVAYQRTAASVRILQYEKLDALVEERANKMEELLAERGRDVAVFSQIPGVSRSLTDFLTAYHSSEGVSSTAYEAAKREHAPYLSACVSLLGLQDLFLIAPAGDVLFTVAGKSDLGSNLLTGPYRESELARIFKLAMNDGGIAISQIKIYPPSGMPAVFLAAPVQTGDTTAGVLAFQLPIRDIHAFAHDYVGLGESGETVLASLQNGKVVMVAPTRHDPDAALLLDVMIGSANATPIQQAVSGKAGQGNFLDYRGIKVLAAWRHLPLLDLGMVLKIDQTEAFAPIVKLSHWFVALGIITLAAVLFISLAIARSISRPIVDITRATTRMAGGDLSARTNIQSQDEIGRLSTAFNEMADRLETANANEENQRWLETGLSRLDDALRGDPDAETLASRVITEIATRLEAPVGAFYIADTSDQSLNLFGSYAFSARKNLSNRFKPGEGLVGQAAREKQQIVLKNVPDDYIKISSQLAECTPRFICVTPFLHENRVKGVIEIGTLRELSALQRDYLAKAGDTLGLAFESAQDRTRLAQSLSESRALAEELQTKQKELQTANAELGEQTQALKQSEEELQAQQEELQVTNEELEEKTEYLERQKRDLMRTSRELEKKADELARSSKYKSEFLANMSHELRTPLNSLLILAGSLAENGSGNLTTDQVESAEIILSSGKALLSLINEILDLSKIEAGQMDLHLEPVSIKDFADEIHRDFKHMFERKKLPFETIVEETAPAVITSDSKRIGQILKNLISNAEKFTAEGRITVTFRSGELRGAPCLAFAVKDTGTGIPENKQKIIFEAFQQADGSTARKYGGTGLGLSISRELTRILGGEIHLKSEEGKGSIFSVLLPLDASREAPSPPAEKTPEQTTAPRPAHSPNPESGTPPAAFGSVPDDRKSIVNSDAVILIIEDDATFAGILLQQCHDKGLKGLIASSGEEGLQLAEKHLPSAVILDLKLPGINGWSVLDQLKNNVETRHIPIHIMSAEDPSQNALNSGAIGFLRKPAEKQELDKAFDRIEDLLQRKMKDLLVIEDDSTLRTTILQLIGNGDVHGVGAENGKQALEMLKSKKYDCIILDLNLPDMSGFELLEAAENDADIVLPPVIVHTGQELTREEEANLVKYSDSIIVKGVRSRERLFDEASLFLHRMVEKMPEKKRQMIANLHDSDQLLKDKTVLVVDDDMRNLFALSNALSVKGVKTIKAQDGQKALDALRAHPEIDLVLMDIMMPVMDGYETMNRIRSDKRFDRLPVIALTAKAMKDDRRKCLEAGASDYLSKPIDIDRLFSMMRVWMYR